MEAMQPHAGIREIIGKTVSSGGDELAARVSSVWLKSYLSVEQRAAVSCLSVFAGSFDAVGAAAVAYSCERARVQRLLQELVPLSVVQEVAGSGQAGAELRYVMHPLVREVAAGMLKALGRAEHAKAYTAFAAHMLNIVEHMIRTRLTAFRSLPTQQLMSDELANICVLARVLLELIQETRPSQRGCDCAAVAATLRHRGELEQALEIEQAMTSVQEQRPGTDGKPVQ